jgi:hypothetical protein
MIEKDGAVDNNVVWITRYIRRGRALQAHVTDGIYSTGSDCMRVKKPLIKVNSVNMLIVGR